LADRIQELDRQLQSDPGNQEIKQEWLIERSRVEGPLVLRAVLADRLEWNQCSPGFQDLVIKGVEQQLGPAFSWVRTEIYSCNQVSHRIATFCHLKTKMELNLIPGGSYMQGSRDLEAELEFARRLCPIRGMDFFELEISRSMTVEPMLIGRFPVTFAQWGKAQRKRRGQEWKGHSFPIEKVTWERVQAWLTKIGDGLRLPWAHEWEYACRAGTETRFFWGQEMDPLYCWYYDNSGEETHRVTEHEDYPNAFGLVDMLGNVSEWCQDAYQDWETWYADDYQIVRGGNVSRDAAFCRCANIGIAYPTNNAGHIGFRAALTLPEIS